MQESKVKVKAYVDSIITEKKSVEEALKQSQNLMQEIQSSKTLIENQLLVKDGIIQEMTSKVRCCLIRSIPRPSLCLDADYELIELNVI